MEPIIEVKHLKKYFNTPKGTLHAVDDVSFTLERGKTLGIVGESGCGKSTIGNMLVHLFTPDEGSILFHGQDIASMNEREFHPLRKEIQFSFSD